MELFKVLRMRIFLILGFFTVIFAVFLPSEGNPLLDSHHHVHAVFLDQKNYFDGIRIFVGTYSDIVAAEMMEILTKEIEGWQRNGKTCRDSIFRPRNTAEIGEAVSICVFGASTHILDVQFLILANVEQAQVETHDIQLALMRELQTANVLKEYDEFYANSVEMARQLRERFYNVTYPPLIESLEALDWSVENIPRLLQDCINAIPRKFTMFC